MMRGAAKCLHCKETFGDEEYTRTEQQESIGEGVCNMMNAVAMDITSQHFAFVNNMIRRMPDGRLHIYDNDTLEDYHVCDETTGLISEIEAFLAQAAEGS